MTADERFSPIFSRKLTHPHLFTIRVVPHWAAISATAELLFIFVLSYLLLNLC